MKVMWVEFPFEERPLCGIGTWKGGTVEVMRFTAPLGHLLGIALIKPYQVPLWGIGVVKLCVPRLFPGFCWSSAFWVMRCTAPPRRQVDGIGLVNPSCSTSLSIDELLLRC